MQSLPGRNTRAAHKIKIQELRLTPQSSLASSAVSSIASPVASTSWPKPRVVLHALVATPTRNNASKYKTFTRTSCRYRPKRPALRIPKANAVPTSNARRMAAVFRLPIGFGGKPYMRVEKLLSALFRNCGIEPSGMRVRPAVNRMRRCARYCRKV